MGKTTAQIWRDHFASWPAQFRRKGVVVPSFGEAIPFVDFVLTEDILVLERLTPDTVGARRVALPFLGIEGLKYTEPLKTEQFLKAGFAKGADTKVPVRPKPAAPEQVQPDPTSPAAPA